MNLRSHLRRHAAFSADAQRWCVGLRDMCTCTPQLTRSHTGSLALGAQPNAPRVLPYFHWFYTDRAGTCREPQTGFDQFFVNEASVQEFFAATEAYADGMVLWGDVRHHDIISNATAFAAVERELDSWEPTIERFCRRAGVPPV